MGTGKPAPSIEVARGPKIAIFAKKAVAKVRQSPWQRSEALLDPLRRDARQSFEFSAGFRFRLGDAGYQRGRLAVFRLAGKFDRRWPASRHRRRREPGCSADMMLEALVACAGVTVSAVATAMGVKLRGGRVVAEGHWDARGTLGVDREAPVGLTDIALTFELDTDADAATVQRLVEMSERFCVIYQTLRAPPRLTVTHRTAARG